MNLSEFQHAVRERLEGPTGERSLGHSFLKSLGDPIYRRCLKLSVTNDTSIQDVAFRLTFKAPLCPTCGVNKTKRKSSAKAGFYKYCSPTCAQLDPAVRQKFETTMLATHGVAYTGQSPKLLKKMQRTAIKNHGSLKESYRLRGKKAKETMLKRYGVSHLSQDRRFHEKLMAGYKPKCLSLKGKTFTLRGYEPGAIEWLHKTMGVAVSRIKTTAAEGLPTLVYEHLGKTHAYHPDILVSNKSGQWGLIEVKSSYTSGLLKDNGYWEVLQAKAAAVRNSGYRFKLLLVLGKREAAGQLCLFLTDVDKKSRTQALKEVVAHRQELGLLHKHKLDDLRTTACGPR